MIEILHPDDDEHRLSELRAAGVPEVDVWAYAADELRALNALDHVDPGVSPPTVIDLDDPVQLAAHSRFVHFPWRSTVVRLPDAELFYRLKTARNRHLLTGTEQEAWATGCIGVAGLSVGSAALSSCALTGARRFRLADPDVLAPTNLNRIEGSVCDIGVSKVDLAARRVLEFDPYIELELFPSGYVAADADAFLGLSTTAASVIIEEIDYVASKIDLRRRARNAGIPVVSATDMGDNVVIDIERYDLDRQYPIFHGRGEGFDAGDAADPAQRMRMAASIVGDSLTSRMAFSAAQLGRSVASWPQLGSTAAMAGALVATVARNIVCGRAVTSGRHVVDVEHMLLAPGEPSGWNELSSDQISELLRVLGVTQ